MIVGGLCNRLSNHFFAFLTGWQQSAFQYNRGIDEPARRKKCPIQKPAT
jgi:hypothetical protein